MVNTQNKHEAVEPPETWQDRFRDAVAPRTLALGVGVLLLQFAFILSYLGAFHSPTPHQIPVAVVAPAQMSAQVVGQLNGLAGDPVSASAAADEDAARASLRAGDVSGVYVLNPAGTADRLLVASGGGTAVSGALEQIFTKVTAEQRRTVAVDDVVPLFSGDARGLSGFYLVVGWVVGGYLFASMLGIAKGSRPATFPRSLWRLGATVPYALASGFGGAVVAESVLHAMNGHFWSIAGIGTLVTLSAATVTIALQILFGVIGIGLTVVIFVILGNPSAGGAYQPSVLPPFWHAIGGWLPNGAGTDAIRRIVYFEGHGLTHSIVVLVCWIVGGVAVSLAGAAMVHRSQTATA
ncbi:ABC transporter permease [Mycolicibacterium sp. Dal123E01]|uniref:ABC transporter permease n=1 Tax=Mycolicibacterium sp. Dal123E01 TaxID=3457578 RepID=UPI00403E6662